MLKKRILSAWLPNWPLQRLAAVHPEIKEAAVVLHGPAARDRRGRQVTACSQAAFERRVRVGMPLAEAMVMLERKEGEERKQPLTPALSPRRGEGVKKPLSTLHSPHSLVHDRQADGAALEALAAWCDRYSPLVGRQIEENDAVLQLDVAGIGRLFGGDEALARQVEQGLASRGYAARACVADTVGAAWAAARFTDFRSAPDGPVLDWLRLLPVAALRLPATASETLRRLGIARVEQLAALPRDSLAARLPAMGNEMKNHSVVLWRLDQATGEIDEPIVPYRPPAEFRASLVLEHPLESRPAVAAAAGMLIGKLSESLRTAGQGAVKLACRFDCGGGSPGGCEPLGIEATLFEPSACFDHLFELVKMQIEQLTLAGPVGRMQIEAMLCAPLVERQAELFTDGGRDHRRRLARLIDRLGGRLGRENVLGVQLEPDAQPECAYAYAPVAGTLRVPSAAANASKPRHAERACYNRPLKLLAPPVAVEVMALAPDGPLVHFFYRGRVQKAVRTWGPERIETGWWRGRSVRRDYFRVETESGHWYWLFRDLQDGGWLLHGEFD